VKGQPEERAIELANYIVENGATVRAAAKVYGISKSTVHKDMTERLPRISGALAEQVKKVLDYNKAQRHLRGGEATKHKYEQIVAVKNR
jgi:putative DeoR family transcriptional regulator (stage III sporulation protein D)